MGKNHRHQKQLKSEKAKVKLKTKGSKHLPKGLNVTDASFKTKKIVIREQLKHQDESQILSHRKLNIKDLLTRLQHYNSSVRQAAIKDLKEILSDHSLEALNVQLNELIKGIAALVLDKEKAVRRESLKALNLILSPVSKEQLLPFCNILISYLICAMTHIDHNIMEDSLLFLDILVQNCYNFLANESHKILLYFLDMISKLHSQSKPGRQLTTNLNSKNTNIKWRIKVLDSLNSFLQAIVQNKKNVATNFSLQSSKVFHVTDKSNYFPIYSSVCLLTDSKSSYSSVKMNKPLELEILQNYIESLMPLMFGTWIEVCPRKISSEAKDCISDEAASLLKCVTGIIQSIIELLELLESEKDTSLFSSWFKNKYQKLFTENLLLEFPYIQEKCRSNLRKNQVANIQNSLNECLEENLNLCYIYVWFTTITADTKTNNLNKEISLRILQFIRDKLDTWPTNSNFLPQLVKVLKVLLIKTNTSWYKNGVTLGNILESVINAYLHKKDDYLKIQLFKILQEIIVNHNLNHLHNEDSFKKFIQTLPSLLLKDYINDYTIKMLNRVVFQYRQWIQEDLIKNQEAIIENAKKIKITGSEDEQNSRLMICNLFYFVNQQVYY